MSSSSKKSNRRVREAARAIPIARPLGSTALLYRGSAWFFGLFAFGVLVAFWPTYYSRLDAQPTYHPHAHGIAMTAWCAMLIAQVWLIQTGRRALHRQLGTLSYLLVPVIALTTINFLHFRVRGAPLDSGTLRSMALVLNALVAFLVLYALGIAYKRASAVHARFMICTVFPLFTPVTDRLIARHMPSLIASIPPVDGSPLLPLAGFALADVMLIALSIWDWRANRRLVFPVALAILVVYHYSVVAFADFGFWRSVGNWYVGMALS
jgi:hypothetical protein